MTSVEGEIPEELREQAAQAREKLIEALADVDEGLLEKFLEGTDIPEDEIKAALRKGALAMSVVPVICGSAFKNKGVTVDARCGGRLSSFAE